MSSLQTRNCSLGFTSSFMTNILYPLSAAYPAILPNSNPRSFFLLANWTPGETPTSSSKKLQVTFVALSEVVIRTLGKEFESQSEKYDVNVSESESTKVSGVMDASSVGVVFGPLEPSIG